MRTKNDTISELQARLRAAEREQARTLKRLEKLETELRKRERQATKRAPELPGIAALAGLRPTDAILDVGCGPGRLTRELVTYLAPEGSYHGIEVQPELMEDLQRRFGRLENFHFHLADLANSTYNREGALTAENYRFPLEDASIDLVVLRSIFTHFVPAEVDNYLAEIARVLKPGGRSYITWFLLDDASRPALTGPEPHPLFRVDHGVYWVKSDENPAHAVAFEESWVREAYRRHGHRLLEPIVHGEWSGRPGRFDRRQDVVLAARA